MKQILMITVFAVFGFAAMANPIEPLDKTAIENMTDEQRHERMEILEQRLAEIKEIPINELDKTEKRELRREVREIQKEAKTLQRAGIYISGVAILVALILLLVLLR